MGSEVISNLPMEGLSKIYPFLGSAFLISVGFLDPSKWLTVIDAGSHFGSELAWILVVYNIISVLCQSFAAHIGIVTGKDLAQICAKEYPQPLRLFLWIQCEFSMLILDFTTILGTAIACNLLFELELFYCFLFSMIVVVSMPALLPFVGKRYVELVSLSMVGLMLIFIMLENLSNGVSVSLIIDGMLPRMRRETLYTAATLLGANVLPHNFYLHSSIVQEQRKTKDNAVETLWHHSFLEISFALSAILLMNIATLSSATSVFHDAGLLIITSQDIQMMIEQIYQSSFAPIAFFLAVFCASQLSTLTRAIGGQVAMEGFLATGPNFRLYRIFIKAGAVVLAMFFVWSAGSSDFYWLLIFFHVIMALQVPVSVIPLFRVASSSKIMGAHRISRLGEGFSWLSFMGMLIFHLILMFELFFGNSRWAVSLHSNPGGGVPGALFFTSIVGTMTLGLLLGLLVTPLDSENQRFIVDTCSKEIERPYQGSSFVSSDESFKKFELSESTSSLITETSRPTEDIKENLPVDDSNQSKESVTDFKDAEDQAVQSKIEERLENLDEKSHNKFSANLEDTPNANMSASVKSEASFPSSSKELPLASMQSTVSDVTSCDNTLKVGGTLKSDSETGHDDDDVDGWENEDLPVDIPENVSSITFEEPSSYKSISGKSDDCGSGSFSRLGLGRAARRNFAAILEEFWGSYFDFHGQLTEKARLKRLDLVLDVKLSQSQGNSTPNGNMGRDPKFSVDQDMVHWQSVQKNEPATSIGSHIDLSERMVTMDSPATRGPYGGSQAPLNTSMGLHGSYGRQSGSSLYGDERRYSSLRISSFRDAFDYQSESNHGSQAASSYLGRNAFHTNGASGIDTNIASRYASDAAFGSNGSPRNITIGSGLNKFQRQQSAQSGAMEHCFSYGNQSSNYSGMFNKTRSPEQDQYNVQSKKYHSLPAISYRELLQQENFARQGQGQGQGQGQRQDQWNHYLQRNTTEANMRYGMYGTSSPGGSLRRLPASQTEDYNASLSRHEDKSSLAFGELSPLSHTDGFSLQSSSRPQNNSLWAVQPFDTLFGTAAHRNTMLPTESKGYPRALPSPCEDASSGNFEIEILQNIRYCFLKLLRLEGSEWLFISKAGFDDERCGFDEELINLAAQREKILQDADLQSQHQDLRSGSVLISHDNASMPFTASVPHCGDGCVWGASLFISFGVWCINRILELSRMESRPELWGKYTYVLNRLQGILEPAFLNPRSILPPCFCLQIPFGRDGNGKSIGSLDATFSNGSSATCNSASFNGRGGSNRRKAPNASVVLEIIKSVEMAVGSRKGRSGTAAGDVAFPKGKENLASVLKRYKRRLSSKPPGGPESNAVRRKAQRQ